MSRPRPKQKHHNDPVVVEKLTTDAIKTLIVRYNKNQRPLSVNFRQVVSWIPYSSERASHFIHPYPAKLLLHIPHLFISNTLLSKPNDIVADPFCGSGTVLLEALIARRHAYGNDNNPLAHLVSKVKTTPLEANRLMGALTELKDNVNKTDSLPLPDVVNLTHWFYPHVTNQLSKIKFSVKKIADTEIRNFFLVCLSSCLRKVSLADPRISVPVRIRQDTYPEGHHLREKSLLLLKRLKRINVWKCFEEIALDNIHRLNYLYEIRPSTMSTVSFSDAREMHSKISNGQDKVSLIVTSPPYAGAQKYLRASSLSLGWLDLCPSNKIRELEGNSIGREHYSKADINRLARVDIPQADKLLKEIYKVNPLRAHIAGNYLLEMRSAFTSMTASLRVGGHIVLVAGNNYVCGRPFPTRSYLKNILQDLGLKLKLELLDTIKSRGLMTKRNSTANLITREAVMLFEKI